MAYCGCSLNYFALTLAPSLLWLFDPRFHDVRLLGCGTCGKVYLHGEDVTEELEATLQLIGMSVMA